MSKQLRSSVQNAGDPEQVRKAEKSDNRRRVIDDEDLQWVLRTESGRRVIQNILDRCFVEVDTLDPSAAIYCSAKRSIGSGLREAIEIACPEAWILMERERLLNAGALRAEEQQEDTTEV